MAAARTSAGPRSRAASTTATRRRLRRACAARSGVARYQRSPASSAKRTSGPSGADRRPTTRRSGRDRAGVRRRRCGSRRRGDRRRRSGSGAAGAGPGRRSPACISRARRSRSAISAKSAGQIGLKLYHWSGAAPIFAASASAMAWVARWSSAGSVDATSIGSGQVTRNVSSGWRRIVIGRIRDPVLRGERRGTGRKGRPRPEQAHRDPVRAIAPVHEQAQDLAATQHAEDLAQVAPRDEVEPPGLALTAQQVEELGERRVVGDHADRHVVAGDGRADGLVAAHVGDHEDQAVAVGRRPSRCP